MSNYSIKTPHAAVLIWNYVDRIGNPTGAYNSTGVDDLNAIEKDPIPVIVSTLSCVSIQTQKSKGTPNGSFNIVLAPFKNWTSTLTAGSWCVLLMSNDPITEKDLTRANRNKVKMFGRIETVRCETKVDSEGARNTLYYISGTDWGSIFNSELYIDNLIKANTDRGNEQGDALAIAIRQMLFGDGGSPQSFIVRENLRSLLNVMGKSVNSASITRVSSAVYEFTLPDAVVKYFDFRDHLNEKITPKTASLSKLLSLVTGPLIGVDKYDHNFSEAEGFIDPFSLQGTHTLWQVLLENSNPALNEMICDMRWNKDNSVQFALFNRIKPFAYAGYNISTSSPKFKSFFQLVKTHEILAIEAISINAGTNWRDKINFLEIKPQFSEFAVVENWIKQKSQVFDPQAFKREGFRSMFVDTKQFPRNPNGTFTPTTTPTAIAPLTIQTAISSSQVTANSTSPIPVSSTVAPVSTATLSAAQTKQEVSKIKQEEAKFSSGIAWDTLTDWAFLMREWYFNTHRLLNGTIEVYGISEYIAVGDNIRFDAGLINPTPNINSASNEKKHNQYILAHVEAISHSFNVSSDGTRTYRTTISFVRGIVVDKNNHIYGEGSLDQDVSMITQSDDKNTVNTNSTSVPEDPDPQKVKGN
jgi:hypothetical protein